MYIYDNSPLHVAVDSESFDIVELLVFKGADINSANNVRDTPLHFAAKRNNLKIVDFLLVNGADPKLTNRFDFHLIMFIFCLWFHSIITIEF